jgi:hypothetical protein
MKEINFDEGKKKIHLVNSDLRICWDKGATKMYGFC